MNPRVFFALALILIGAAIGLSRLNFDPQPNAPSDASELAADIRLFRGELAAIQEILIHRAETLDVLRIEPAGDGIWSLTEPLADRAEPVLLRMLFQLLASDAAAQPEANWDARTNAELGLANPRIVLEIRFAEQGFYRLAIGARHSNGMSSFAERNGERILVPRSIVELLERPSNQWRDHTVLRWPLQVVEVKWQPNEGEGFTARRTGQGWELTEPVQSRVDPIRVRALDRLIGMRAASLPSDSPPLDVRERLVSAGGLLQFTSLLEGQQERSQEFRVYDSVLLDVDRAFLLPTYNQDLNVLAYSAEELRSKRLLNFEPSHIVSLRVHLEGGPVELRRSSQGWTGGDGELLPSAARKRLTTLLVELANLETVQEAQRPSGELARQLQLSISARPVERGATVMRWWPSSSAGGSVVSEGQSRASYQSASDYDAIWAEILGKP
jgi:Domain of unknown function (DUF4340)